MGGAIPDDFWLEWHPTRSVLADVADAEWEFLTGTIRELDVGHGYTREVGRVEAGRLLAVVDNRSRNLDPTNRQSTWWPNLGPLRHVRVVATSGGVDYVIWRGFTTSFDPHWAINDAWVVIEGYDSLYAAAKVISDSILDTAIESTDPDIWLPLRDGGAAFAMGRGRSPGAVASETVGASSIMPFAPHGATSFPVKGQSRADVVLPGGSFAVNPAGFTIMAVFKTTSDEAQVILSAGPQPVAAACPSGDVALVADAGGSYSLRVGNAGGSSLAQYPRPTNDSATLVIVRYDPVTTNLNASMGLRNLGGGPALNAGIGGTWAPRPGLVRIGAGLDAANDNPFLGALNHVALWNRWITDGELYELLQGFYGRAAFSPTWPGQALANASKVHEVIGWVLDRLGIAASRRDLDTGALWLGATAVGIPAIDMMSRAAATEGGYFFADRAGNYTFRLRGHKGVDLGTYDTAPPAGSTDAALADLTFANDDRSFFTTAAMTVTSAGTDAQEVIYRHPNAAVLGDVAYDAPTQFHFASDALAAGVLAVGDATPGIDVVEAVVQMGAPGVDAAVLLASDLLDEASIVARPPDDAGPGPFMTWGVAPFWGGPEGWAGPGPHSQLSTILHVGHTYDRNTHTWRTRWALTPS